jgi:formate C-acetyltransferase
VEWFSALQFLGKPGPFFKGPVQLEKIVKKGLRCIIDEAKDKVAEFKASLETDIDKLYFWQSVVIVLEAMIVFAHRHAEHASSLAADEPDPQRRAELQRIAQACRRVPEHPARTMHEGFQAVVLTLLGIKLETPHLPGDSGRMDQYLWDLFKSDYEQGSITLQLAGDLFASYLAIRACVTSLNEASFIDMSQTVTELNLITLGGVDRAGRGADNVLTYLFLQVAGLIRLPEPHLTLRWHPETPQSIMRKAHETSLKVAGNPQFVSDGPVEQYWTARGVPVEKARDQSGIGCLPPLAPATTYYNIGCVSHAKSLELTLHNGHDPLLARPFGLETGDPLEFESFDQLYAAYRAQHEFWVARLARMARISYHVENKYIRKPFFSSIFDGCVERGRDLSFRDAPGCHDFINDRATIDAADSLMAIKKLVFDEKKLSMAELIGALDSSFAGVRGEEIRQWCLAAPKYGNDSDEVDELAGELGAFGGRTIRSHTMPNGSPIETGRPGVSWHYFAGGKTGALPNGRRAREPLNDGSLSPMRGQDRYGPTAVFRSVLRAGFRESLFNTLNQRVSPTAVRTPETMDKLLSLTRTYMKHGGMHVQYNIVDTETMRRAQETPEEYRDLVVRIGGFSAYFVLLTKEMQDDVIMRTEQAV